MAKMVLNWLKTFGHGISYDEKRVNPDSFNIELRPVGECECASRNTDFFWVLLNEAACCDLQYAIPNWTGFNCLLAKKYDMHHVVAYLPAIDQSPTKLKTVKEVLLQSKIKAEKLGLFETEVVLDLAIYAKTLLTKFLKGSTITTAYVFDALRRLKIEGFEQWLIKKDGNNHLRTLTSSPEFERVLDEVTGSKFQSLLMRHCTVLGFLDDYYWAEMQKIPVKHPAIYVEFRNGFFSVRQQPGFLNALLSDQVIEQTINKEQKCRGGITGYSTSAGTIQRWVLTSHSVAKALHKMKESILFKRQVDKYCIWSGGTPEVKQDLLQTKYIRESVLNDFLEQPIKRVLFLFTMPSRNAD
eukprot:gene10131-18794_t